MGFQGYHTYYIYMSFMTIITYIILMRGRPLVTMSEVKQRHNEEGTSLLAMLKWHDRRGMPLCIASKRQ